MQVLVAQGSVLIGGHAVALSRGDNLADFVL